MAGYTLLDKKRIVDIPVSQKLQKVPLTNIIDRYRENRKDQVQCMPYNRTAKAALYFVPGEKRNIGRPSKMA